MVGFINKPRIPSGSKKEADINKGDLIMVNVEVAPDMKDDLQKQAEYVERQKARKEAGMGLIFADAFLRGMRDIGYKSPATAIDELVDNAIQANATFTDVVFDNDRKAKETPRQIAVVDNGHGMLPDMIYYAVKWGGTHRENDRSGFGRYGYGLPSSAISLASRYTVYSKVAGQDWHALTVDIFKLADMAKKGLKIDVDIPSKKEPPEFVFKRKKPFNVSKLESGTVVVLEDLDRLKKKRGWSKASDISAKLLKQFGVIYRNIIPSNRIFVNDQEVQIVDPLFLMESGRFYDENPIMAVPVATPRFETETADGKKGFVKVRASWLPANFQVTNPNEDPIKAKSNNRFPIMKEYNGLLICRAGRQIDCLRSFPWGTFVNYDRNIKIEIDFDPELDEFFGMTTAKQQIEIDGSMWSRLETAGVLNLFKELRVVYMASREKLAAKLEKMKGTEGPRSSEEAMLASEKYKTRTKEPSPEKVEKAEEKLRAEAARRSERTGKPLEQVLEDVRQQTRSHPYKVEFEAIPEGPFYIPNRIGLQKKLIINTTHPFYSHLYDSPDSTPGIRSALEVLLFAIADGELGAEGDFELFYKTARKYWSERLEKALLEHTPKNNIEDKKSARQEEQEVAAAKAET